jgi:hypothetical protein
MAALYTACLTVLIGVSVFVFGQIVVKFFIEPIHDQYRMRGKIADSLIFYVDAYGNPGNSIKPREDNEAKEASKILRQDATQLISKTHVIPLYRLWELLRIVHKHQDVKNASLDLIRLSTSITIGNRRRNGKARERIIKSLNLRF